MSSEIKEILRVTHTLIYATLHGDEKNAISQNIQLYIIRNRKLTTSLFILISNVAPIVLKHMAIPCTRYNIM